MYVCMFWVVWLCDCVCIYSWCMLLLVGVIGIYDMELQLGLALIPNTIEEFDLNSSGYDPKDVFGSDTHHEQDYSTSNNLKKKRSFDDDDFLAIDVPQTLPLFFREDNHTNKDLKENSFTINKSDGDENGVIGWPPIKSCRKKLCRHKYGGAGDGGSKSLYVKVNMEGVAIARKVDLSLHHSYETLTYSLLGMFDKCQEEDMKAAYKLTYQDKEGDWLLAGDLPWGTFMRSVQRLKLIKKAY